MEEHGLVVDPHWERLHEAAVCVLINVTWPATLMDSDEQVIGSMHSIPST